MVLVSETLPTILSNLEKQFSILNLVFNFETLPTILSNLGKQFSNSFPKSIYVVSHTRRCLDGSTLATLFCLNYFAANLGYKYLFLLHEKQSTLGVWKTAPTSAAWATAFYSTCSHFCNCCTYSHSVCSKMKNFGSALCCTFSTGGSHQPPSDCFSHRPFLSFCFLNWPQS